MSVGDVTAIAAVVTSLLTFGVTAYKERARRRANQAVDTVASWQGLNKSLVADIARVRQECADEIAERNAVITQQRERIVYLEGLLPPEQRFRGPYPTATV